MQTLGLILDVLILAMLVYSLVMMTKIRRHNRKTHEHVTELARLLDELEKKKN